MSTPLRRTPRLRRTGLAAAVLGALIAAPFVATSPSRPPGLTPDTAYDYRVGRDGAWTDWRSFRTAAAEAKPFEFIYYGDAQNQLATVWKQVADNAAAKAPNAAVTLHTGDLIDYADRQQEWTDWFNSLGAQATTKQTIATPGNHEYFNDGRLQHFKAHFEYTDNGPNLGNIGAMADLAVGDSLAAQQHRALFEHFADLASDIVYYVDYQGVRFISLDTEAHSTATNPPSGYPGTGGPLSNRSQLWRDFQAAWLRGVLEENPNQWTVVTFHKPILNGHDHTYARGYVDADATDTPGMTTGPVYAVSNSGGKWYSLASPTNNVWTQNGATQVTRGENVSLYSVVAVDGDTLRYDTYVGARNGNPPEQIGDLFDSFTITKNSLGKFVTEDGVTPPTDEPGDGEQQVEVTVPEIDAEPGELVWSIDGGNDLVDLGTAAERGDRFEAAGEINPVRVTDTRLGAPAWSVSGQIGDFTSGSDVVDGRYLGWTPRLVDNAGGGVAGDAVASGFHGGQGLKAPAALGTAPVGHALGSVLLGADLDLQLPVEVTDGTYRATLTLTALS